MRTYTHTILNHSFVRTCPDVMLGIIGFIAVKIVHTVIRSCAYHSKETFVHSLPFPPRLSHQHHSAPRCTLGHRHSEPHPPSAGTGRDDIAAPGTSPRQLLLLFLSLHLPTVLLLLLLLLLLPPPVPPPAGGHSGRCSRRGERTLPSHIWREWSAVRTAEDPQVRGSTRCGASP